MKKILKVFYYLFVLVCIFGIGLSIYKIIGWKKSVDTNNNIKKKNEDYIEEVKVVVDDEGNKKEEYSINFDKISQENSDVVGYLKIKGTKIDYFVVRGQDNDYYLNHNFYKNYNDAGWIFADYHNDFDGKDKNIVIYGHNMKDESMFGTLYKVFDESWLSNLENRRIIFVDREGTKFYDIFSTYTINPEEYYLTTNFAFEDYSNFLTVLKSRSTYDFGINLDSSDKILTLSSCSWDGKKRIVVHAKLVK